MKKINIMALIVSMPMGGVENQVLSILKRLNRRKYNTLICCIKELGSLGKKAEEMGIRTLTLNLMKSSRFSFSISRQISRVLKENDIHILWTHQYVANLYGRITSILAKTPAVVANFHALYDTPKTHRKLFNRLLSYKTDALVAVSKAVANDVHKYDRVGSNKIKVIYNGTDLKLFNISESKLDCRKKLGLPENDIIVGNISRLSIEKNHKIIIEALNKLSPNVKGFFVGDGPIRKNLEKDGGDRVYFTGQMNYSLIPLALKAMDIFCFPSLWEGFGTVLVEAMAAGLPVIASDIPSHNEVIGNAGIVALPDDADEIAEIINTLIDNPSTRNTYSAKAMERAKIFSIDSTVAAYEKLFKDILDKKGLS